MAQDSLVSCLCVTEGRSAFMPWLLWCFDRQTWPHRELVIIDSSSEPFQIVGRDDVRIVALPLGTSVGRKRNLALQEARGEVITWFDDDDWQHPNKLVMLVEALREEAPYVGAGRGWFVNLMDSRCVPYRGPKGKVTFNSAAFRKEAVLPIRFREDLRCASDTHWMRALEKRYPGKAVFLERDDLFFWLCHEQNLSNPLNKRRFTKGLEVLKNLIGCETWGDTDERLEEVRKQLHGEGRLLAVHRSAKREIAASTRRSEHRFWSEHRTDDDPMLQENELPPVGLMIKATVMDALYLDTLVRHMISQARYPFAERTIVVDRPLAFTGKYARRPRATHEELGRILEQLLSDGVVDHVREVDTSRALVQEVKERYFSSDAYRVPNYAATGGPIYATLYGLESMSTDHVLQMDADLFFYADAGVSWVEQALQVIALDPQLWLMMTHPGPPAGRPGESLGPRNARRSIWDPKLGIWRFQDATTRYFLCDRRNLHHRLQFVPMSQGCAPLEQCMSRALLQYGAFRGNLGDHRSWHLHAWHHGDPFPQWASSIARAVECGRFPAFQQGDYDLRLDRPQDRKEWVELLALAGTGVFSDRKSVGGLEVVPGRLAIGADRSCAIEHAGADICREGGATCCVDKPTPLLDKGVLHADRAAIAVIIPIRNRAGARVRNALRSLSWQSVGRPDQILVVSHGSKPEINRELSTLCDEESATLISVGDRAQPWNKPLALNMGIRATRSDVPFVMTMDADMILAPNFLEVVLARLEREPPALILCRISDLPPHVLLPNVSEKLMGTFHRLVATTRLRPRFGSGGIQAARRSFFFQIRGYDEDLLWWGAMDGDMLNRARLAGMKIEWVEDQTIMLHQWHPRKHAILIDPAQIAQAKVSWRHNHQLIQSKRRILKRNPSGWGGVME